MIAKLVALACALALSGCGTLSDFATLETPPGDYGRPAVVRGVARAGTYVGSTVGIVASVVFWLPIQGLTALVDEPLGYTAKEWNYLPLAACGSAGHYLFGAPAEAVDWLVRGAWVDRLEPPGFAHIPGVAESPEERR